MDFLFFLQFAVPEAFGPLLSLFLLVVALAVSFFAVKYLDARFSGEKAPELPKEPKTQHSSGFSSKKNEFFVPKKQPGSFAGEGKQAFSESLPNFKPTQEQNLVKTIKELLRESTPEDEIVRNLKDLGLDEKSAKKLILIAQSDALEVFRDEIDKITKKNVQEQLSKIQSQLGSSGGVSYSEKVESVKENLDDRLEEMKQKTNKPKEAIARNLVDLAAQLEEIKLPELKPKKELKFPDEA